MDTSNENVMLAFALTLAASLCTTIGAASAFLAQLQDRLVLAGSLGLSAGVMLFISFVEIFQDSYEHFRELSLPPGMPLLLACACFFSGVLLVSLLDFIVHQIESFASVSPISSYSDQSPTSNELNGTIHHSTFHVDLSSASSLKPEITLKKNIAQPEISTNIVSQNDKDLRRASLITALAVGIHNFPEGLITFAATISNPQVGLSVSIAIAIHNIPEGLCVAMPLYFSTGDRWRAFWWATASGASGFVGAIIGWAILRNFFTDCVFGIIFGLISGMMVCVSVRELLPVARKYDPNDRVVSWSMFGGMAIMAFSLALFQFTGSADI